MPSFSVKSGARALTAIQGGFIPNVLVTEVELPDIDERVLASKVRELASGVSVVFIPARGEVWTERPLRTVVLPKPFPARALTLAVRIMTDTAL